MAYSREDIDRVRERTDLVELASEVTRVKRSGRSVMAVCPFHSEKTPSFTVDPNKSVFYCFGCQTGGDVFKFVMLYEKVDFVEAVKKHGLTTCDAWVRAGLDPAAFGGRVGRTVAIRSVAGGI